MKKYLLILLAMTMLSSCAFASALFPPAPQTPSETIVAADAAVQAAAAMATAYENAGLIKPGSSAEKAISAALSTAKTALNNANADVKSGNTKEATLLTSVAQGLLSGVQNALADAKANSTPTK